MSEAHPAAQRRISPIVPTTKKVTRNRKLQILRLTDRNYPTKKIIREFLGPFLIISRPRKLNNNKIIKVKLLPEN